MSKYYSSDITWCNCGCKNRKCDRHICNLDLQRGAGFYSVADFSEKCPGYTGNKDRRKM